MGLALPEVIAAYGGGTVWYLHLPHSIATEDGTGWTYSAADGLGSVRQRLDGSGGIDEEFSYRPFGSPLQGDGGDPYGFTGEAWDAEAGLLYLRARYYDPRTGRFLSQDPWPGSTLRPGTLQGFAYLENDPINGTDPSGMCPPGVPECRDEQGLPIDPYYLSCNPLDYPCNKRKYDPTWKNVADFELVYPYNEDLGFIFQLTTVAFSIAFEPVDWVFTLRNWMCGDFSPFDLLGLLPLFSAQLDDVGDVLRYGNKAGVDEAARIRFAQKGISRQFRHGEFAGRMIDDVAAGLKSGKISPDQLPIKVVERNGVWYTINNRSLMTLRQAGLEPTVIEDVTGNEFFERQITQRLREIGGDAGPEFVPKIRGGER